MKEQLVSIEDIKNLHPLLNRDWLARFAIKLAGLHHANRVYDNGKYASGPDVEDLMLDEVGVIRKVHHIEVLNQFEGKPFIVFSNHPYGHIDGIMLVGEMAKVRPDFKLMVNWVLGMIDTMQDHFIGVNPFNTGSLAKRSSMSGVKKCIQHLQDGHPLGFFPAGAISKNRITRIEDRDWQPNVLRLIKKAGVPVVPVFISGHNSGFFNFIDLINWRLRTVRLCHELNNKKGKTMQMVFGEPVFAEEQQQYTDITAFGKFLKSKTYALQEVLRKG